MRIHLIAIGGAVMHNLALALQKNGHEVSGSDDEIYNPAKERLERTGLLPVEFGWFPEKITNKLDFIILGMHARADNPELQRALELGVKVYSFPEFIYKHAENKTRVVVAGSHGKTTTTAMIMHALKEKGLSFDYLVGAQLEGFDLMVQLSDAPIMVIEGDEYLSSPLDRRAKFLHYMPQVAIITGIAWDHVNVFPTYPEYKRPFEQLAAEMNPEETIIYFSPDQDLCELVSSFANCEAIPYSGFPFEVKNGKFNILREGSEPIELDVFGEHNMANLKAAQLACEKLGVSEEEFLAAAKSFQGAAKRLQSLVSNEHFSAWLDFAHAPSKVEATVKAVKSLHPQRKLVACVELHTFSSLNKNFLPHYNGTLAPADIACVYYSHHTVSMKKMEPIDPGEMRAAFNHPNLQVFTERTALEDFLRKQVWANANLLMMTSGNYGGMDLKGLCVDLTAKKKH